MKHKLQRRRDNWLVQSGIDRHKRQFRTNLVLLLALGILIFVIPVISNAHHFMTRVLLCVVVISGLFAADFSRIAFRILFSLGFMVITVTLLSLVFQDYRRLNILTFALNVLFFSVVTVALIYHVARTKEVFSSTLLSAINSYLLIGLTLSLLFLILELFVPGSFNNVEPDTTNFSTFSYFGFVTLTTLGYGDITPITPIARSLTAFTALFGQLYLVITMAIIIGKLLMANTPENEQPIS
jgi:voltage-gated potassium channel